MSLSNKLQFVIKDELCVFRGSFQRLLCTRSTAINTTILLLYVHFFNKYHTSIVYVKRVFFNPPKGHKIHEQNEIIFGDSCYW